MATVSEALDEIARLWAEQGQTFAFLIFEPVRNEPQSVDELLKTLKMGVESRGISILPKLVQLSTFATKRNFRKNSKGKAEMSALLLTEDGTKGVDYEVSKPMRKQDFIKIFKRFKYSYRK